MGGEFFKTIDSTIEAAFALEWNGSNFVSPSIGFDAPVNDFTIYDNKLIIAKRKNIIRVFLNISSLL